MTTQGFDATQLTSYALTVRVGELAAPGGQTELTVHGDGSVVASQREANARLALEARSRLETPQTEFLMRSAEQFTWADAFPPRPGIPDEPIVRWTLQGPGGRTASARMWLRDAERSPLTGEVLVLLRQVIERASDGRMYL